MNYICYSICIRQSTSQNLPKTHNKTKALVGISLRQQTCSTRSCVHRAHQKSCVTPAQDTLTHTQKGEHKCFCTTKLCVFIYGVMKCRVGPVCSVWFLGWRTKSPGKYLQRARCDFIGLGWHGQRKSLLLALLILTDLLFELFNLQKENTSFYFW